MSRRWARAFTAVFFTAFALVVTWPGMLPFNRVEPLVLGLPFSMAWVSGWVLAGGIVLWVLDAAERKARDE